MKFYAVKKGNDIGVFKTWEECKKSVYKYSGAIYKSFNSLEEANKFIYGTEDKKDNNDCVVYVDGSFRNGIYTWAFAVYENDKEVFCDCGRGPNNGAESMRNVAGEVLGVIKAISWAVNNDKKILIVYDYQGIEFWAKGFWKTNNKYTKYYSEFCKKYEKYISFKKVKAHTNNIGNDRVDHLAKSQL